jgi:hypothetical protein
MCREILANESLLVDQVKLDNKKKNATIRSHVPHPTWAATDGAATTRQLMNMTTYIHRFNTTGTLAENRDTDPGKSVSMQFVARFTDLASSAAQLARVSCVPSPNEPTPCGDVTDFGKTAVSIDVDDDDECMKDVAPAPDINEKGFSHADGVQVLSLQYDSDIDDDNTDDECEFDTDRTLLENLQTILETNNTVVVEDDDDSVVPTSPCMKSVEPPVASPLVGAPVEPTAPAVADEHEEFLAWMDNPVVFGVPCDGPAQPTGGPVMATNTSTKRTAAKRNTKEAAVSGKSPKRAKNQAMLPQRKSPARAAKTKNDIAKDRLSGVPPKKKTEEEMEAERNKRIKTLHKSQTAELKKKMDDREQKEKETMDEAVKQSLKESSTAKEV